MVAEKWLRYWGKPGFYSFLHIFLCRLQGCIRYNPYSYRQHSVLRRKRGHTQVSIRLKQMPVILRCKIESRREISYSILILVGIKSKP